VHKFRAATFECNAAQCEIELLLTLFHKKLHHNVLNSFTNSRLITKSNFTGNYCVVSGAGCADPEVPENAMLIVQGDRAVIHCNATGGTWHIVCRGGRWRGYIPTECGSVHAVVYYHQVIWWAFSAVRS